MCGLVLLPRMITEDPRPMFIEFVEVKGNFSSFPEEALLFDEDPILENVSGDDFC